MRGLSDVPFSPWSLVPAVTTGASLTTVVLIGLVPTVVHTITMEKLRQTLGDIPTGEIAKGAIDILSTPMRNWDEKGKERLI